MIDEEKRKKVMRGLEAHVNPESCETCAGEDCPYYNKGGSYPILACSSFLASDALALLKAQMPRIVTTADFENNPNLDDGGHLNVWEEYKDSTRSGCNTIMCSCGFHEKRSTDLRIPRYCE